MYLVERNETKRVGMTAGCSEESRMKQLVRKSRCRLLWKKVDVWLKADIYR